MTEPITLLGAVAAATQSAEQVGKSCFLIVKEILRARKDLKDAPKMTEELFKVAEFAERVLTKLATFTPKENEPNELVVLLRKECDPNILAPDLNELYDTLCLVRSKVTKFQEEDKNREGKMKSLEMTKNLFHQGGTKQKKEGEKLYKNLDTCLRRLDASLTVVTCTKASDTHYIVSNTHEIVSDTHVMTSDIRKHILEMRGNCNARNSDEEHVKSATAEFKIDNDMVKSLIDAADCDLDDDSHPVEIEWKAAYENAVWIVLGESSGGAGVAGEDRRQRASVVTGWPVYDCASNGASVRFMMSVPDRRFFYFLSYAHKVGAELELFFPKKNTMINTIQKGDSKRLFPDCSRRHPRDPPNWALKKDSESFKSSTESVFLIFSKETLVRAEAQSTKGDLKISDVAGELEKHLERKSNDEGCGYDDIIVKRFLFDIRANMN